MYKIISCSLLAVSALTLSACGGSGGGLGLVEDQADVIAEMVNNRDSYDKKSATEYSLDVFDDNKRNSQKALRNLKTVSTAFKNKATKEKVRFSFKGDKDMELMFEPFKVNENDNSIEYITDAKFTFDDFSGDEHTFLKRITFSATLNNENEWELQDVSFKK
jgi:hypothetical protein